MTALLLASQRIFFQASPHARAAGMGMRFHAINRRGVVTGACLVIAALGVGVYIFMLVSTFGLGIQLRKITEAHMAEERGVKELEMALRSREANFALRYAPILDAMDEVSSIVYLDSDGVAMK